MPTHQEVIGALDAKGANVECLSCGANEWIAMGEGGESDRLFLITTARGDEPEGTASAYPMHGLYCDRCGYVRLHHPAALGL
jgi:hypothetical protein